MTERLPEDVAIGVLRVVIGGSERSLPTLKAKYVPEWARKLDDLTPSDHESDPDNGFAIIAQVSLAGLLDLIVAYDRTGALGGREWIEENADPSELAEVARQMAGNAFPFGNAADMVVGTMQMDLMAKAVRLVQPNSTNGPSPIGASTRKRSARASTRSS